MPTHADIAVLGTGPAGVATARALRRLGYEVVVVGTASGRALEGLSDRTLTQLRECGLHAAASRVSAPGERAGAWGGAALAGHVEYVVDRAELDRALLEDAASSGVMNRPVRAVQFGRVGAAWRVRTTEGLLDCRVLIDARGRRAQRRRSEAGPALIAVSQRLRVAPTGLARTRIHALRQGWSWLALNGRGTGCLQVITSPGEPSLRDGLESHLRQAAAQSPAILAELRGATPEGKPIARAAAASLAAHLDHPGLLAVGDASVAADPLCGHGIYEALRSASVAAAAANTFLTTGDWHPAATFIRERAREIWQRCATTAAFHYGRQAAAASAPFWLRAAAAYRGQRTEESGPAQSEGNGPPARIDSRPVLNGSRIEVQRVVVSPRAARGVWKVDDVELAALLDFFRLTRTTDVVRAAQQLSCEPARVARAARWLQGQGLLQGTAQASGPRAGGPPAAG